MKTLGQIAYEAHWEQRSGVILIDWIDLIEPFQDAWEVAAKAVYDKILIDKGIDVD